MTTSVMDRIERLLDLNAQLTTIHFCQLLLDKRMKIHTLDNMGAIAYAAVRSQMETLEKSLTWKIEEIVRDVD